MTDQRTNFANRFETTLTVQPSPTDLTLTVASTTGGPAAGRPAYFVIEPDVPARVEFVEASGVYTGTSITLTAGRRYLTGSAAASGITHPVGSKVKQVPTAQMWEDLHDRVDADAADAVAHAAAADPHPGYLTPAEGNATYLQGPLWIPATAFAAINGSPSLASAAGSGAGWLLDAAADETVGGTILVPVGWATMHVDYHWMSTTASAGDVRIDVYFNSMADGAAIGATQTNEVTATSPGLNIAKVSRIHTGLAVTAGVSYGIRATRNADHAADTLPADMQLLGVKLTRAS